MKKDILGPYQYKVNGQEFRPLNRNSPIQCIKVGELNPQLLFIAWKDRSIETVNLEYAVYADASTAIYFTYQQKEYAFILPATMAMQCEVDLIPNRTIILDENQAEG